jgi:HD-GYP domain-containing protein (c-di-GMP phosphodiesterase class II)
VTQSDCTYLQKACDELTQLVSVEGIAIFLDKTIDGEERLALTAGSGVVAIDHVLADIVRVHLARELSEGKEAFLDSDIDSPFKYQWPERIKNIIAVPLTNGEDMLGVMIATNVVDKQDFDSTEIKLFNTVAHQCAVFMENERLFGDLKELFIGALKALTSSIDAKDQYTRGHSERVAFISRWIAERLAETRPLSDEQIHKIYLSGLLHDVGKIGVNEAVLCKKGKLTEDELARIKAHPQIGASILSEIKQMKEIVPGVLCHHERIDGKGYPKGLKGDRIPLIGKIISLADAFDAMTSRRVYREALSIKGALVEIEKGIGTQFDEEIATVFLNSDIKKLWNIIQDGFIERWDYSNFSEYGSVAVGTLIK